MRAVAGFLVGTLVLAACGTGGATTTTAAPTVTTAGTTTSATTSTTEATTTTTPTITSTVAPTTTSPTTTTPATTTTLYGVFDGVPPVLGGSGDPHGSGCAPPAGDALPDGVWFGYAVAFDGFGDGDSALLSLDLACYFSGEAAVAARIADGLSGDSDASEYVRNKNPKLYEVRLLRSADAWSIPPAGPFFPELLPAGSWPRSNGYFSCPGAGCPVWIYVNNGVITALVEQFFE